jgi:hypothetical protein
MGADREIRRHDTNSPSGSLFGFFSELSKDLSQKQ